MFHFNSLNVSFLHRLFIFIAKKKMNEEEWRQITASTYPIIADRQETGSHCMAYSFYLCFVWLIHLISNLCRLFIFIKKKERSRTKPNYCYRSNLAWTPWKRNPVIADPQQTGFLYMVYSFYLCSVWLIPFIAILWRWFTLFEKKKWRRTKDNFCYHVHGWNAL